MTYRGLATDLDGTFVLAGDSIHPRDLWGLQTLLHRGVPLVIATGRSPGDAVALLKRYGISTWVLASYGTTCLDLRTMEVEENTFLPPAEVRALERWACSNGVSSSRVVHAKSQLGAGSGVLTVVLETGEERQREGLLSFVEAEGLDLTVYLRRQLVICHSGETDKGTALKRLARRKGWSLRRFVALGNDGSDLTMLEAVGHPVAVGEREPSLVESAHEIVSLGEHPIEWCVKTHFAKGRGE